MIKIECKINDALGVKILLDLLEGYGVMGVLS